MDYPSRNVHLTGSQEFLLSEEEVKVGVNMTWSQNTSDRFAVLFHGSKSVSNDPLEAGLHILVKHVYSFFSYVK